MLKRALCICCLLAAIASVTSARAGEDSLLAKARALLDKHQAAAAYKLLAAEQQQREGQPDYDFLLGLAALDSGKPALAVFALERVLAQQPNNARARAELARAYFDMGETESAKEEFQVVKLGKVPPSVEKTINKYLSAIEHRAAGKRSRVDIFVQSGFGYDSNVNSATDSTTVAIPALGGLVFTLNENARGQGSAIWRIDGGFRFATPLAKSFTLYGGASLGNRLALDQATFTTRTAEGTLGLELAHGDNKYRLSVQGQRFFAENDINRDLGGFNLEWQHRLNARNQITAFAQAAAVRYPGQEVRNVNRYVGGLGWAGALPGRGNPVIFASTFLGTEYALDGNRDDISRNLIGARVGGQYNFNRKALGYASFSYQYSRYGADDPLFLTRRQDHYAELTAGVRYALDRHWSVSPQIRYINNDSTLPINTYDRVEAMVMFRNDF